MRARAFDAMLVSTFAVCLGAACGDDGAGDADTSAPDTSAPDTSEPADTIEPADTSPPDTSPPDTSPPDTSPPDTLEPDTTLPDTSEPDVWARPPAQLAVTQMAFVGNDPRTIVGGTIWSAAPPETYVLVGEGGACRIWLGENYFCQPFCADDELCTMSQPEGVCTPYPATLSAGNLTVSGAGEAVSIKPEFGGYASETPGALWDKGELVTFSAPGDEVPGFEASLRMVEPLTGANLDQLTLGAPLVVTWDPPTSSGDETRVRLVLQADRGQHGRAYAAVLECDVPDTGRVEIPADLQARYVADDVWGCGKCPSSTLTRYAQTTIASGTTAIGLRVESQLLFLLTPWTTPAEP